MAYIHVNKKDGHFYYSLRQSYRKNGQVNTKHLGYIGKEISEEKINNLYRKDKDKIKNLNKSIKKRLEIDHRIEKERSPKTKENKFFDKRHMEEINAIIAHHKRKFKKEKEYIKKEIINNIELRFIQENISIDYTEKENPSLKDVMSLINDGIARKKNPVNDIYKIVNTKEVIDFLEKEKRPVSLELIENIFAILFDKIMLPLGYRKHDFKIMGGLSNISKAKNIKKDLKKLLKWFSKNQTKIHPLVLVILFHNKFEKIHPFYAGNGEIGRILMNYMLSKLDYPPIIISRRLKEEYYEVMDKAYPCLKKDLLNTDMRYCKPLIDFMQKQFVKTYWNNFLINN